jgi:hypothetical protein
VLKYIRSGNKVEPVWLNRVTGRLEKLTWEQIKKGGSITPAHSMPYSRMSWEPFYLQTGECVNPRRLKPDNTLIKARDWDFQR